MEYNSALKPRALSVRALARNVKRGCAWNRSDPCPPEAPTPESCPPSRSEGPSSRDCWRPPAVSARWSSPRSASAAQACSRSSRRTGPSSRWARSACSAPASGSRTASPRSPLATLAAASTRRRTDSAVCSCGSRPSWPLQSGPSPTSRSGSSGSRSRRTHAEALDRVDWRLGGGRWCATRRATRGAAGQRRDRNAGDSRAARRRDDVPLVRLHCAHRAQEARRRAGRQGRAERRPRRCRVRPGQGDAAADGRDREGPRLCHQPGRREQTMSDCCPGPKPKVAIQSACPRCGTVGRVVEDQTIEAILKLPQTLSLLAAGRRFCRTPSCEVVYYGDDGRVVDKHDTPIRVGLKEREDPIPLCYCFGFSAADVRREIAETGSCTIPERITAGIRAGRCSCEVMNPSGTCCLGEVNKAVEEALPRAAPGCHGRATWGMTICFTIPAAAQAWWPSRRTSSDSPPGSVAGSSGACSLRASGNGRMCTFNLGISAAANSGERGGRYGSRESVRSGDSRFRVDRLRGRVARAGAGQDGRHDRGANARRHLRQPWLPALEKLD